MKIIYCQDPVFEHEADSMFIDELGAATRAGLDFELINYDAISENNNAARAVRDIAVRNPIEAAVYRGWPLTLAQYSALYEALLSRGLKLINNPEHYAYTQHLPNTLPLIQAHTPKTVFYETDGKKLSYSDIIDLLQSFDGKALFLRDYAKSEKFYWSQAAFIPENADRQSITATISRFLLRRGKQFEGGLVFREFVTLQELGDSSPNNMPMAKEARLIYLDGKLLYTLANWEGEALPENLFVEIAGQVQSRFFSLDIAQKADGEWVIIDLGDAQLAKLPVELDLDKLYQALAEIS